MLSPLVPLKGSGVKIIRILILWKTMNNLLFNAKLLGSPSVSGVNTKYNEPYQEKYE